MLSLKLVYNCGSSAKHDSRNERTNVVKHSSVRKRTTTPKDPIDYSGLKEGVDFVYVDFDNVEENNADKSKSK